MRHYPKASEIWVLAALMFGAGACDKSKDLCTRLCDAYVEAAEQYADDYCDGFEDSKSEVKGECKDACGDLWSDMSNSEKKDADQCITCVIDDTGGSPDNDDLQDAYDVCQDECGDQETVDFINNLLDEWMSNVYFAAPCSDTDVDGDTDMDVDMDIDMDTDTDTDTLPSSQEIGSVGGSIALEHASLGVPPNAIVEGGSATYTIERVTSPPPGIPGGGTVAGDGARFSPEGIVFATPVEVTVAVPSGISTPEDVAILRHDGANWEFVGGAYVDQEGARGSVASGLRAYVSKFSEYWPVTISGWKNNTANIRFVNNNNTWYNVCIQSYTLTNPSDYPDSISPQWEVPVAPPGTIGWLNAIRSSLPAGTYAFQYYNSASDTCTVGAPEITLNANSYDSPTDIGVPGSGTAVSGYCECQQTPTPQIGEGALQITLSWNTDVDLDLHVITPNSEEIYYSSPSDSTGGQLDIDDRCGDGFGPGGPENVFWSSSPPAGEYVVNVNFWSDCSSAGSANWAVRINSGGNIIGNYSGTATTVGQTTEVTRFTE